MERETIQFSKQQTTSASKALWPVVAQKCAVTSRTTQHRRKIMIWKVWLHWLSTLLHRQRPMVIQVRTLWPDVPQAARLQLRHIALALTVGCAIPLLCSLYSWIVLPMLGVFAAALTLVICYQVLISQENGALTREPREASSFTMQSEPVANASAKEGETLSMKAPARTQPLFSFPDTPMPVPPTPLVRILETIDLSSSDVEHFLDIPSDAESSEHEDHEEQREERDVSIQE